jgi:hypothetical protein
MTYESTLFGIPMSEAREAILFYQRFKETPTYKETVIKIKREHLESELARIEQELKTLNDNS